MSTLNHKIGSIWCYKPKYEPFGQCESWYVWTRVVPNCTTLGGQNHNSWGRNSLQRWEVSPVAFVSRLWKHKQSNGWFPRPTDHGGHIPDILPPDGDVLVGLLRTDVLFTTCVAAVESRTQGGESFDTIVHSHFQTGCGLNSDESLRTSPCEAHPSERRQKFI